MESRNTNEIVIQSICWFYSQGIPYDARSYYRKIHCFIILRYSTVPFAEDYML